MALQVRVCAAMRRVMAKNRCHNNIIRSLVCANTPSIPSNTTIIYGITGTASATGGSHQRWPMADLLIAASAAVGAYIATGATVDVECEKGEIDPIGLEMGNKIYRRAEVAQHRTIDTGIWVTYRDGVYDVTDFLSSHPGGVDKLMLAAGGDLLALWKQPAFQQHLNSPLVMELLKEMRIGSLHPEDCTGSSDGDTGVLTDEEIDVLLRAAVPLKYSQRHIYDCIVVGAGVSGLRCANALTTQHGLQKNNVLVLEAQDYVGGRVRQMTEFIKGVKVEVGAEFLHGSNTELTQFAKAHGEPLSELYCWAHGDGGPLQEPVDRGYGLYYVGGGENSTTTTTTTTPVPGGSLLRYDDTHPEFQRMNTTLWDLKDLDVDKYNDDYSLADYLATKQFDATIIRMAEAGYANTLCANAGELSLRRVIRWSRLWEEEGGDGDFSFDRSWSTLVNHLSNNIQIELRSPVSSIEYTNALPAVTPAKTQTQSETQQDIDNIPITTPFAELVKVTTKSGATYYTRAVVVTSSPHVLQRDLIRFHPPLSPELRAAINSVNMNSIVKIFLKFSRPVWPKDLSGMIVSDPDFLLPEIWFKDVSTTAAADEPAKAYAVGFTTADYAKRLSSLPRHEVLKKSIDQFDQMFALLEPRHMSAGGADDALRESPEDLPKPSDALLGVMYWDWNPEHHPYIGGGYCSPKAGANADLIDTLRLPHGNKNMFFAGEATNLPGATAHAALESGVRAAQQVASLINK